MEAEFRKLPHSQKQGKWVTCVPSQGHCLTSLPGVARPGRVAFSDLPFIIDQAQVPGPGAAKLEVTLRKIGKVQVIFPHKHADDFCLAEKTTKVVALLSC